jgi:fatty-acyl-CoA synthase
MWDDEDTVRTVTFKEFVQLAQVHAARFRQEGVRSGDTAVLVMPQGIELMAAFAGAMMLGAAPAILAYPNFKVEPKKYRAGLRGVSANLHPRVIVLDQGFPPELESYIEVSDETRYIRAGGEPWGENPEVVKDEPVDMDSVAFIQHSAGTTGLQKGVALSHRNVLKHLEHLAGTLRIREDDRIYSWLPLYHDMGLIACFMLPMVCHVPVVMQSPTAWVMEPGSMLELMSSFGCTLAWVPNFTLQFVAKRMGKDDLRELDLSGVRAIINCSEPVRPQSIDDFQRVVGPAGLRADAVRTSYAMAENVFAVTQSSMGDGDTPVRVHVDPARFRDEHVAEPIPPTQSDISFVSSGRTLPGNEIRVVSADGADLVDGGVGELLIHSDHLFGGYFNRPDLTDQALDGKWYRSGDLGFRLEGEIFVVGRKKDLIIQAGKNIYPQDIEEIASSDPAIHDGRAVAFGVFNPDLGTEDIVVVAELESVDMPPDRLSVERGIRNAIVAELGVSARAIFLKPPHWIVKSTAGKPARSATREKLLAEHPELGEAPVIEM